MAIKPKIGMMVQWNPDFYSSFTGTQVGIIVEIHKLSPNNGKVTVYWFDREYKTEHIPAQHLKEVENADST
jgi:hypothetical protein